ncbi:hypothetical protein AMECASPLE_014564 [Ameca splendens]|uniref:Reverse transcriptase domain-containing protein n=1 Tax=Ameca splendens TaxID=208324 RepID=A0ABV0YD32_9TELE
MSDGQRSGRPRWQSQFLRKKPDECVSNKLSSQTFESWKGSVTFILALEQRTRSLTQMKQLMGSWKFGCRVHVCFMDREKAYDPDTQGILWELLWVYDVPR